MRTTFGVLVVIMVLGSPLAAQRAWQTEIGLQGGFTRLAQPGSGVNTDAFSLPGFNLGPALPFAPGVYAIIPWKRKLAIELDGGVTQLTSGLTATLVHLGVRADYAVAEQVYVAGGVGVGYANTNATVETQLAAQGAVGYRRRLSGAFNGRVEARATFWGKSDNFAPINAYSLLVGVSTVTNRSRAASSRAAGARSVWRPQLGFSAGYANVHAVGSVGDVTFIAFPSFGGGLGMLAGPQLAVPPTVFAILPVGRKIAIEPGLDLHRTQEAGTTQFLANASARLNYALHGGWYAALGGNLNYFKTTGADAGTRVGVNTAVGYRFAISDPVGGRVELNYTMFGRNDDLGAPPVNVLGLMFGATVPLQ